MTKVLRVAKPDPYLTGELASRDGVIYYWQRMAGGESWMLMRAFGALPAFPPETVSLLVPYLGGMEWIFVSRADIVVSK